MVPGYREVRELGAGSGGRVVLATYSGTGAYVAIKYLDAALRGDGRFTARFREEARVMVELDDPNIVRLYEYYEDVLEAAVVMELVDGVPLRRILRDHGAMSPEAALAVLKGVLLGLARTHSAGVLHRDLRPENVLVQADGTGKLADFGVVAPGTAGVPGYTAPERRAGEPASAAADLYAAACVFSECLTGRRPYRRGAVPVEELPAPVRGLAAHGTADDPRDRPPTARAFAAELEVAALAAYGPEWERRGRRRLAELATLLALAFPLARAAPGTGPGAAPAGRNVIGRGDGLRRPRLRARFLAGAGAAAFAVTAALVAAGRPAGPLASDKVFTPPPETSATDRGPAARTGGPVPSGAPDAPEVAAPSRNATVGRGAPSPRASAPVDPAAPGLPQPTHRPSTAPPRSASATSRPPAPPRSETPAPSPSRSTGPGPAPASPGDPTPGPGGSRTPPAPPHAVGELAVTGVDADGATISVRASTTTGVVLTVRFAEGPAEDRLAEAPVRALVLSGSTAYLPVVPHGFTAPSCGRTVLWRVTAETRPQAPGGARSRTVAVTGAPCPEAAGPGSGPPEDVPEDVSEDVPEDVSADPRGEREGTGKDTAGGAAEDPAGPAGAP